MRRYDFLFLTTILSLLLASSAQAKTKFPPFSKVEKLVRDRFTPTVTFREGDLITKSEVRPVLSSLKSIGWTISEPDLIMDRVLDDNDFLVRELRSPKGQRLYRRVANIPGAIDHLDRMRDMPRGKKTLDVFVQKTPGNADVTKTILTTKRGQRYAKDVAKFNDGKDFNKPTERIYRVNELIAALKQLYAKQLTEMKQAARKTR